MLFRCDLHRRKHAKQSPETRSAAVDARVLSEHWPENKLGNGGFAVIMTAGLLLLASVGGNLLGIRLAGRVLGWTPLDAKIIGWLLQTKALIEIIFASVLLDRQVISSATFTALLLMAIASTMLTIPRVSPLLRARGTSTE